MLITTAGKDGFLESVPLDSDQPALEADTFCCVHCNRVVVINRELVNMCHRCMGPHCERCHDCVPYEQLMEMKEAQYNREQLWKVL